MTQNRGEYDRALMKLLRIEALYNGGMTLEKCCKTVGISVHSYYKWRREGIGLNTNRCDVHEGNDTAATSS